jgi:hypothetical protein
LLKFWYPRSTAGEEEEGHVLFRDALRKGGREGGGEGGREGR